MELDVCPKLKGGLGIKKLEDDNRVIVTKLAWIGCTQRERPCVKLVREKYLRERRILHFELSQQISSWIYGYFEVV